MGATIRDIESPQDVRRLSPGEMRELAQQLRAEIVETVSKNGGHLASSLGAVELTLALHTSFETPKDKLVWDVGHQAYAHKLITGRYKKFGTLRKMGGISGYPKRQESVYDVYDTGHAAGSISYALGLAKSRDLSGDDYNVVAVIGDGSLTSGIAYEALNNAGELRTKIVIVLNDNSMSISESVGGISYYLTALRLAPLYRSTKERFQHVLDSVPNIGARTSSILKRFKSGVKQFLMPESWFESLGLRYYGPIDGHDIEGLQRVFDECKTLKEPVLVHVVTKKGKGYAPAEAEPEKFHGPGPFDPKTGEIYEKIGPPSWNKVFGNIMCRAAETEKNVVAITAAMSDGTGLGEFKNLYPHKFFDVGIAESHAVTFAAGLAQGGHIPVVAIYSTFLQRAYDQIVQDVCLQGLKVIFAVDRAGIVGEDGETHHGEFDLSYLKPIPGLTVMAPKDEEEFVNMFFTALKLDGPSAIRYPRGRAPGVSYVDALKTPQILDVGKAQVISSGRDVNLIAMGSMVYPALAASKMLEEKGISCGVVNARYASPFDAETIKNAVGEKPIVVVEENVAQGGLGDSVLEAMQRGVLKISIPKEFVPHGTQEQIRESLGLDAASIAKQVESFVGINR